ncbi:MAG: cap-binding protein [Firmicutes bacterium]|nr:cap-binding protein [Bacillota bacterium]
MDIWEAIDKWEKDTTVYIHYSREMKSSEYNQGFADGLDTALASLKSHIEDCTESEKSKGEQA